MQLLKYMIIISLGDFPRVTLSRQPLYPGTWTEVYHPDSGKRVWVTRLLMLPFGHIWEARHRLLSGRESGDTHLQIHFSYLFQQGDSSIFHFSHTRGIIPSAGSEHPGEVQVTLTFTPTKPINYYR